MQTKLVFRSHTLREKCNDNLRKFVAKLHKCPNNNFEILQGSIAFFSNIVQPRNLKLLLHINPYRYSMQTKFHVRRSHSFREKYDNILQKIQSCTIVPINSFEILQVSIAFFSDTVRSKNLKFFLYINPYKYPMLTKFHVSRSHSF